MLKLGPKQRIKSQPKKSSKLVMHLILFCDTLEEDSVMTDFSLYVSFEKLGLCFSN